MKPNNNVGKHWWNENGCWVSLCSTQPTIVSQWHKMIVSGNYPNFFNLCGLTIGPPSSFRRARRYTGYNALRCNLSAGRSASRLAFHTRSYFKGAERLPVYVPTQSMGTKNENIRANRTGRTFWEGTSGFVISSVARNLLCSNSQDFPLRSKWHARESVNGYLIPND